MKSLSNLLVDNCFESTLARESWIEIERLIRLSVQSMSTLARESWIEIYIIGHITIQMEVDSRKRVVD